MTDTDPLAALLKELDPLAESMDDLAARLAERGVRVTGDAGLRDRLLMAVGPVIGDHIGGDYPEVPMTVLYRFQSALVDAVLAALTGDTPEAHP